MLIQDIVPRRSHARARPKLRFTGRSIVIVNK